MTEWREVVLGDLCDRVTVGHVGKMADEYVEEGVPFLRSQNIKPFTISTEGVLSISERFHQRLAKSTLRGGDVVVIRTGYPGIAAVVPPDLDGSNCADLVVITPSKELNPHMLVGVFNSAWGRSAVGGQLVGSAQQHFNIGSAKALRLRLPDREGQDRVAAVLCVLGDLIENNRRRIELLEQMAQTIYREWFVHFRYPGHEDATLADSDSPLGPIPEGWEVKPLGNLATLDRTSIQPRRSPDEAFHHYSIPAFDDGKLPVIDAGETIKSGKYLLVSSAVLVSKLNPRSERTWFVEPVAHHRSVTSTEFLVLRPCTGYSLEFLYLMARSGSFRDRLRELSGGTSTSHQRAKPDDFLRIDIVAPPAVLAGEFAGAVAPALRMARLLCINNRQLAGIRDLLLPKLVTGQIDVSNLDLDTLTESVA